MKLPLSEVLKWGTGSSKNLPINQVISIMLELKRTNNWNMALLPIPKRKLREKRTEQQTKKEIMILKYLK